MRPIAAFALPALLAGCMPYAENVENGQAPPESSGLCNADKLDHAVGQKLTADLEARLKREARAELVRVAPHDGAITMDHSPARLNIFIDEARKIIRINCG